MPKISQTEDGSSTLYAERFDEYYHSTHGAKQESNLIYIDYGLRHKLGLTASSQEKLQVFEMGFGTGLNAFLTLLEAERHQQAIHYINVSSV